MLGNSSMVQPASPPVLSWKFINCTQIFQNIAHHMALFFFAMVQFQSFSSSYSTFSPSFSHLPFPPSKSLMTFYIMSKISANTQMITWCLLRQSHAFLVTFSGDMCQGISVAVFVNWQSVRSHNCKHGQGWVTSELWLEGQVSGLNDRFTAFLSKFKNTVSQFIHQVIPLTSLFPNCQNLFF